MSLNNLLATLAKGVDFVENILPVVRAVPGIGNVVSIVETALNAAGALSETVQNVQQRIEEGKVVAASDDQAQLKDMIARIQAANDELAAYIAAS